MFDTPLAVQHNDDERYQAQDEKYIRAPHNGPSVSIERTCRRERHEQPTLHSCIHTQVILMARVRVDEDIRPLSELRAAVAAFVKQIHEIRHPMVLTQRERGVGRR